MQLPHEPSVEIRSEQKPAKPERTVKLVAHRIHALEVISYVKDDLPPPGSLDHQEEVIELIVDVRGTGTSAAVPGELEVDRGRESASLGRSDVEEMASLIGTGRAQV